MSFRSLFSCVMAMCLSTSLAHAAYRLADVVVVVPSDAPEMVKLAGCEAQRYVYLLTGKLPPTAQTAPTNRPVILLQAGPGQALPTGGPDPSQNYALAWQADRNQQLVAGASPVATLWAAYHLIENWGVGFYLGGDTLPKPAADLMVEPVNVKCRPVLAIRGNQPWFNFMNSPTTWNPQDYKTFFAQMAKQRANLIGFHVYDHEPFCGYDIDAAKVTQGAPLMTTVSKERWWSPPAMATSDYLFGTDQFFDRGGWGCEVGIDDSYSPARVVLWQQKMMVDALVYAHRLGIRTCMGFEASGNPGAPEVAQAFRKHLSHTLKTYPLDYLCLWQSEGRGTAGTADNAVAGTPNDESIVPDEKIKEAFSYLGANHDLREAKRLAEYILLAHHTLKELKPGVRLVVGGWGGDAHMQFSSLYEGLDKVVPDDVIFAALDNIDPRQQEHVAEAYGRCKPSRERWPIPWFESDCGHSRMDQTGPQTNVTAFEPVLKDIVKKGCQGALGIHWRTRNVEDVAGYLYRFGWNAELTPAEFFRIYARDNYGPADAEHMAKVHLRLEEFGPQYVGAAGTVECSSGGFGWFVMPGSADKGREPNRAGHLPAPERFPELEAMASDLTERSQKAAADGRRSVAIQYHDLAATIRWLVIRAKVGLAIWGDAPLEKRLRQAEELLAIGNVTEARGVAQNVLKDLSALKFREAMQALASTCRTRGELGMLATTNARYGVFYASFVQRIARILGRPLTEDRGTDIWKGEEVITVYPVPGQIAAGESVNFDAVLLASEPSPNALVPLTKGAFGNGFRVELRNLAGESKPVTLNLKRLGGSYYRAVFEFPAEGMWSWSLVGPEARPQGAMPLPASILAVSPPARPKPLRRGEGPR